MTRPPEPRPTEPAALCRHEELARRENLLRAEAARQKGTGLKP
jgi:hypothetical protein